MDQLGNRGLCDVLIDKGKKGGGLWYINGGFGGGGADVGGRRIVK